MAIESVFSQDYPDIEYIIIDGGSRDGTFEYIQSLGNNISMSISEPDKGLYDALNKGVRHATGDVVGFLHADDLYASTNVLSMVAASITENKCDSVYGDLEYVDKSDTNKIIRYWKSGSYDHTKLKQGWMPPHLTFFVKRSLYEQAKLPNGEYFDTTMKIAADYDFMMRLLNKNDVSVQYLPEVLVKMRIGGTSNKSIKNIIKKSAEDYKAIRRNNIGGIRTLLMKNLSKITQFYNR